MKSAESLLRTALLKGLKPVQKLSVSDWADKFRQLPSDSPEPGHWRTSRVPYMKEVMDSFTDPKIRRVVVKSSAQLGKSETLLNVVGRFAQIEPCSIFIVQPTLEMAQDFSKSRLSKMIADTKSLTPLFYDRTRTRDANQTILSKFYTGGRIVLAGANSPASLASRPIRILLCDEVDRFPADCGEGDPISLAEKRTSNFFNAKIGIFSTPTTEGASRIDIEYNLGTREEWRYRCPNCHEWHILDWRQVQVDFVENRDEAGNKSVIVKSVVWQCPDCGFEFSEFEMKKAPQKYVAQNPEALQNGVRSFWLNAFSSPWLSWNDIMREWLEAKGDPSREAVVMNTRFGLSYRLQGDFDDENIFLKRRESYDGEIPSQVLLLTAGVDVQANRLEYCVSGWCAGETCYAIFHGVIYGEPNQPATWAQLDEVLDYTYHFADGTPIKISRTFIDSGFATSHVYDYCGRNFSKGRFAIKGKSGGSGITLIHKITHPLSNILLVTLGVDEAKNEIFSRLALTEGDGMIHFGLDDNFLRRGFDENYFKQLLAEHKVIKKVAGRIVEVWETVTPHARNEALDISCYAFAAMKSCIGNNPKDFWLKLRENLRGEPVSRPKTRKKPAAKFVERDIYD